MSRHLVIVLLWSAVLAWSPAAHSYSRASGISFSTLTATLSGYSQTWKDPWDADYYVDCVFWAWDDVYGYQCMAIQTQINYAHVFADLNSPAGLHQTTAATDFTNAVAGYSAVATMDGTWSGQGRHYVISDFYYQWCPYNFCTPPLYTGSMWFDIGTSEDQVLVTLPVIISMKISRHDTTSLSMGEALGILGMATELLQTDDNDGDTACSVLFLPIADIDPFSESGPEGVVNDQPEMAAVMAVPGLVQVVNGIEWCNGPPHIPGATITGCGNSQGITVRRWTPTAEGVVWAHEYGHNQGLSVLPGTHNPNSGFLMNQTINEGQRRVTASECNAFLNPI